MVGQGALIGGPFENIGGLLRETAVSDVPEIRMIGPPAVSRSR
uniref:Uncharacterized protein n=1 Tax=uncultured bacterium esnapd14 TaxID=1366594 RepID=S5UBJ9_9BACT|nr:hypothetical protein [uncultured bacterium esnapd14]